MAGFKLNLFKGIRPRTSSIKLPPGEAQTALNVDLGSGDIEPFYNIGTEQAVSAGRATRTIHRFDNNGDPIWLEWDDFVDVARGPVKDDVLERTYYTGDTAGTGAPKMTNTELVGSGGGPYPESWVYIGVPAPANAPTITAGTLPEDVLVGDRFVPHGGIVSDELIVDNVNYTVYPGTGTENAQWTPNAAAEGTINFDVDVGTTFRVTSIINANKVKLESGSSPGIFARTLNSDQTTINDWNPYDEGGTTQEATFEGFRIPVGVDTTIIGHNLAIGDIIKVSALSVPLSWIPAFTDIHYEQAWLDPSQKSQLGSLFWTVPNARITPSLVSGGTQWDITGSFYYDVDRLASAAQVEDRTYVYTYVTENDEEGPPSEPSITTPTLDGAFVLVGDLDLPPTIGYTIDKMRLYRTNSTVAGTEYQFVKEFPVSQTTSDTVPSAQLGEIIVSTSWDPPPTNMIGITEMPNGMLVGFAGKNLYFCEPYFPHAWPSEYDQAIGYDIVGLSNLGNAIAVMTKGPPYVITGAHPRNANVRSTKVNQACLSKESIATDNDNVYYASPDGLVEISANGIRVATEDFIEKKDWAFYSPNAMVGAFHEGRYYGFYDFDANFIDPTITAEVSGSISTATELDIVAGGKEIILTLTNDQWVDEGIAFDNTRTAIIAGLVASTNQSLGWNNLVIVGGLTVGDVVRTSNTVVTITLPLVPGYETTSSEVIQPTIPNAALVLSNTDLATGSTFTVTALTPAQTLVIASSPVEPSEASIVAGGNTITLTIRNDTWITVAEGFDAHRQAIIDGLISTTDETNGWNDTVPQLIPADNVVRTSDLVVTITLPAVPLYSVLENEAIYSLIPGTVLGLAPPDIVSLNTFGITATGAVSAFFSGSILTSTENQIIAGSNVIVVTLTNDTWIAAGTGPVGTIAQSQAFLTALLATTTAANGWTNEVIPVLVAAYASAMVRTSDTVITVTLPAVANYALTLSETVGQTISADILTTETTDLIVGNTFAIQAQSPSTCVLSLPISPSVDEDDITDGGVEIKLTLGNDTWKEQGTGPVGSTADTQALIDGISSDLSEALGWDLIVRDNLDPALPGDVERTSDTVVTITLPAFGTYDITATETITATVPVAALQLSAVPVVATPDFEVAVVIPAVITMTGTITESPTSTDVYNGGLTMILTVANDIWVDTGAAFQDIRTNIIAGLTAASTPAAGWNNKLRDLELVPENVVRTSNTVVTITLPNAAYDINLDEVITATVPAVALQKGIPVVASPAATITAVTAFTSRIYVADDEYNNLIFPGNTGPRNPKLRASFFNPKLWNTYDPSVVGQPDDPVLSMAYMSGLGAGDGRLVLGISHTVSAFVITGHIFTSDDDGISWTERTSAIPMTGGVGEGQPNALTSMLTVDGLMTINMIQVGGSFDGFYQYSADGITWVDITAAIHAGEPDFELGTEFYLAGNYVYHMGAIPIQVFGDPAPRGLIRSADMSGAGTIASNWGTLIESATGNYIPAYGTGNGKILGLSANDVGTLDLEWMAHGATSMTFDGGGPNRPGRNPMPASAGVNNVSSIAFGDNKWIMLDVFGGGYKIDVAGEVATFDEVAANWTRINQGDAPVNVSQVWYDTEIGFIAIASGTIYGGVDTKVYTSTDLLVWTLENTFTAPSYTNDVGANGYQNTSQKVLTGTGLD
jgi:hypothetical protein